MAGIPSLRPTSPNFGCAGSGKRPSGCETAKSATPSFSPTEIGGPRLRHTTPCRVAMPEEFYRIKRLPPYVFSEVNSLKASARAAGRDVIDLGMGNPDGPTPPHIVAKLVEAVQNPRTHGYSVSRGITGLRRACAAYYARRFEVELDPEREVIVTLGSKEGLANLAQAITAPGDVVLVPNPC